MSLRSRLMGLSLACGPSCRIAVEGPAPRLCCYVFIYIRATVATCVDPRPRSGQYRQQIDGKRPEHLREAAKGDGEEAKGGRKKGTPSEEERAGQGGRRDERHSVSSCGGVKGDRRITCRFVVSIPPHPGPLPPGEREVVLRPPLNQWVAESGVVRRESQAAVNYKAGTKRAVVVRPSAVSLGSSWSTLQ